MEYQLGQYAFDLLEKKVAPLNKRAAKLGLPPVGITVLGTAMVEKPWQGARDAFGAPAAPQFFKVYTVEIAGVEPKVGDYEFAATLDQRDGGTILRKMPTFEGDLPERFRNTGPTCDHCQKIRRRSNVYVVHGITNDDWKQVGKQCLKDFLGSVDPDALAAWLAEISIFFDGLENPEGPADDEGWFGGRMSGGTFVKAEEVLQKAAQAIRMYGWVPKSLGHGLPTAERVRQRLFGEDRPATTGPHYAQRPLYHDPKWTGGDEMVRATESGLNLPLEAIDLEVAAGTLAYVASLPGRSDFEHNLQVLCHGLEYVRSKDVGMVAAAVMVYERHLGNEAKYKVEREQKAKLLVGGQWVGKPKERFEGDLILVDHRTFDGNYGVRTLVTFADANGNTLKWWKSGVLRGTWLDKVERGESAGRCAYTVKAHGEYQGKKETTVLRVSPVAPEIGNKGYKTLAEADKALADYIAAHSAKAMEVA